MIPLIVATAPLRRRLSRWREWVCTYALCSLITLMYWCMSRMAVSTSNTEITRKKKRIHEYQLARVYIWFREVYSLWEVAGRPGNTKMVVFHMFHVFLRKHNVTYTGSLCSGEYVPSFWRCVPFFCFWFFRRLNFLIVDHKLMKSSACHYVLWSRFTLLSHG